MTFDYEPTSLKEAAVALHETYTSLCEAGFTEAQALYIITANQRPQGDPQ